MAGSLTLELRKKYRKLNIPWVVHFELTYRCNLRCVHCYLASHHSDSELSLKEIKNIIDELKEIGTVNLTFSGGEVFLREDLLDLIRYSAKNFIVILLTNGTLITSHIAKMLKKAGVTQVEISLHGTKSKFHDEITCVPDSYDKVIRAIHLLREEQIPVVIKGCMMDNNYHDVSGIRDLALRMGASYRISPFIVPKIDGSKDPLCHRASEKDIKKYFYQLISEEGIEKGLDIDKREDNASIDSKELCDAGSAFCSISPSGMVRPCVLLPYGVGNLREESFRKIWHDKPEKELKSLREATLSSLSQCKNCDLSFFCRPCIGANYLKHGDMYRCSEDLCSQSRWIFNGATHSMKGG